MYLRVDHCVPAMCLNPAAAAATEPTRYRRRTAPGPPRDGPVRKPAFPRDENPASPVEGRVTATLGHETLLGSFTGTVASIRLFRYMPRPRRGFPPPKVLHFGLARGI